MTAKRRIAIVLHQVENQPWGVMVQQDIEAALADYPDFSVELVDSKGEADNQAQRLEDFLKAGIDALVVYPIDPEKVRPILREYKMKGIPVVALSSDPGDPELYRTLITANDRQYGRAVGKFFVEVMGGEGDLVEICGVSSTTAALFRSAGFREAIASSHGIQIVDQCTGNWLYDQARREFAQILSHRKKIDGVFAHNDEMAQGAWDAARAVGREKEMLITGIDAIRGERAIQMVVQGQLAATFLNPSPARAVLEALQVIFSGGTCVSRRLLHTAPFRSNECIRTWQQR